MNSALQRARTTLERADRVTPVAVDDDGDRALLAQSVAAFADFDLDRLVTLLHDDATHSLPTGRPGLEGADEWNHGRGAERQGSRLIPVDTDGTRGFVQHRRSGPGGHRGPRAEHHPEIVDGKDAKATHLADVPPHPAPADGPARPPRRPRRRRRPDVAA